MKKIFQQIVSKMRVKPTSLDSKPKDLRVGAEHFAKKFGPAIKQLSKE